MVMRLQKYDGHFSKYCFVNEFFIPDEIEKILFLEKIMDFDKGMISAGGNNNEFLEDTRNCSISFFGPDENTGWIFDRLAHLIPKVNYDIFMLNIEGLSQIQYTIYDGKNEEHYDWHIDQFSRWVDFERKISGVVFLSDPSEYEGGELEIITEGNPNKAESLKPNPGDVVFFASTFPHRVKPVTKGKRKTLVFWAEGKREGY